MENITSGTSGEIPESEVVTTQTIHSENPEYISENLKIPEDEDIPDSESEHDSPEPRRALLAQPQPYRDPSEKKPKLRTSKDVYDRLKWDSESIEIGPDALLDLSSVYVGYKDRFLGMCELAYQDFQPGGDIPFHRIYYFRTGGAPVDPFIGEAGEVKVREDNWPESTVILWDRDSRTDLIFNSGNSTAVSNSSNAKDKKPSKRVEIPQEIAIDL